MKQVQIICDPSHWDSSVIRGCNIPLNGRVLRPRSLVAADLPAERLAVWHAVVAQLKGLAPGEWAATLIVAERGERQGTGELPDNPESGSSAAQAVPVVKAVVYRHWDDGTTAGPIECNFEEAAVLELFDWLVSAEAYEEAV